MRLIDAEVLLEKLEWLDEYDYIVFDAVKRTVDEVPTVEAIPIEWIKEWTNNYCDWSQEKLIDVLLRTWSKKNEVKDDEAD